MRTALSIIASAATSATLTIAVLTGCGGSSPHVAAVPYQPTAADLAREAETAAARAALIEAQRRAAETARANQPTATPRPPPTAPPPPPTAPARTLPESTIIALREELRERRRDAYNAAGRADRAIVALLEVVSAAGHSSLPPPDIRDHIRAGKDASHASFYGGQRVFVAAADAARLWITARELGRIRTAAADAVVLSERAANRGAAALAAVRHRLEAGPAPDPTWTTTASTPRTGSATFSGRWVGSHTHTRPGFGTGLGSGPATIAVDFAAGQVRADLNGIGTFSGALTGPRLAATLEADSSPVFTSGSLSGAVYGTDGRTAAGRFNAKTDVDFEKVDGAFDTSTQPQGRAQ